MNDNDSESFKCKEHNCGMTFFNEQSLAAHQQTKHSKLNLEIPSKNFSDNQTPTPTRLLNKCEELRVFDDPYIQSLNPFDEGFRQAIHEHPNRDNFLTTQQSQDTLHTPQIIPDFIAHSSKGVIQDEPENLSLTPDTTANIVPKIIVSNEASRPIPLLPKPSVIYATPIISTSASTQHHITDDRSNVKDKLKSVILGSSSAGGGDAKRVKLTENDSKLKLPTILIATPILTTPGNLLINSNSAKKVKKEVIDEEGMADEKESSGRRKSDSSKVERNRAAARRYRTKMKAQGQALKDKYDRAIKEIGQLRKEVTELKKLLLLHKDCEVTRRMSS